MGIVTDVRVAAYKLTHCERVLPQPRIPHSFFDTYCQTWYTCWSESHDKDGDAKLENDRGEIFYPTVRQVLCMFASGQLIEEGEYIERYGTI